MSTTTHDGDTLTLERGETIVRPVRELAEPGDHDRFAHYAPKRLLDDVMLFGGEVTALCGHTWRPRRDPNRYPICPDCKARWEGKEPGGELEARGL